MKRTRVQKPTEAEDLEPVELNESHLLKVSRGEAPSIFFGDRFMTDAAKKKAKEAAESLAGESLAKGVELLARRARQRREQKHLRARVDKLERMVRERARTAKKATHTNGITAIGRNIDTLRKECGWSFDQLAEATGIDKKSILSHVNKGARPIPRILKEYAQAFSKALGRKITAPDLEK